MGLVGVDIGPPTRGDSCAEFEIGDPCAVLKLSRDTETLPGLRGNDPAVESSGPLERLDIALDYKDAVGDKAVGACTCTLRVKEGKGTTHSLMAEETRLFKKPS